MTSRKKNILLIQILIFITTIVLIYYTYLNKDNTLTVEITIKECEPYKFGEISFVGNKIYTAEELIKQLGMTNGDVFDQSILDARLFGSLEGNDISSLYLDDGYCLPARGLDAPARCDSRSGSRLCRICFHSKSVRYLSARERTGRATFFACIFLLTSAMPSAMGAWGGC